MNEVNQSNLADDILRELAQAPEGISTARLCKRLNVRMSSLLRCIAWLGTEPIGDQPGLGLVRIEQQDDRTLLFLITQPNEPCAATALK